MAKNSKRGKKRLAKLRKKLGFLPKAINVEQFGSFQERVETHGKACTLGKSKREIREQVDRKRKQKGWEVRDHPLGI